MRTPGLADTSRRTLLSSAPAAAVAAALLAAARTPPVVSASWLARDPLSSLSLDAEFDAAAADSAARAELALAEYERDGVAVVRRVVGERWVSLLRQACEDAQDDPGPAGQFLAAPTDAGAYFTDLEMARRMPAFAAFACAEICRWSAEICSVPSPPMPIRPHGAGCTGRARRWRARSRARRRCGTCTTSSS